MSLRIVRAMLTKDLREFSRNRYWVLATVLPLILMAAVVWMLPERRPAWTITVGLCPRPAAEAVARTLSLARLGHFGAHEAAMAKGIAVVPFEDEEHLRAGLEAREKKLSAGVALSDGFIREVTSGREPTVTLYVDDALGDEVRDAVAAGVREVAYAARGAARGEDFERSLPVRVPALETVVRGTDLGGDRFSRKATLRLFVAISYLAMGAVILACIVADEIKGRAIAAVMVTPASAGDVFAATSVTGVVLTSGPVLVYLLATWPLEKHWAAMITLVLLGAVMTTSLGMIVGSIGGGFAETIFWGVVVTLPLIVPLVGTTMPGTPLPLVQAIPSYGFIKGMVNTNLYRKGWEGLAPCLWMTLAWDVVLLGAGSLALRRKLVKP
jgi:hypothetical protein